MRDVPARIDHTVLGPTTTPADVEDAVSTAAELGTNVCVPPSYVPCAREQLTVRLDGAAGDRDDELSSGSADGDGGPRGDATGSGRAGSGVTGHDTTRDSATCDDVTAARDPPPDAPRLVTVVGFPHGQDASAAVLEAAEVAVEAGADELDVVANVGRLLGGEDERVRANLEVVADAVSVPVKAIVCAPLLDDGALERACEAARAAGCSHVKTATGFNGGGATVEDVELMAEYLPVKASGGIGSWDRARELFEAGATRIGASSGDVVVREWRAATAAGSE